MLMTNVVKIDVDGNAKRVEVHTRAGLDIDTPYMTSGTATPLGLRCDRGQGSTP